MKLLIPLLAALALLTNCIRPIPPQSTPAKTDHAENLTFMPGYIQGEFENGVTASIYRTGGACIIIPGQSQLEIVGEFLEHHDSFLCSDTRTGDYVLLYKSGKGRANVKGVAFDLLPKSGTVFAKESAKE